MVLLSVTDSDGEFLLIEAAHHIPKWLKPETAENRVREGGRGRGGGREGGSEGGERRRRRRRSNSSSMENLFL